MNEKICVWANGSTNPITRKNELPEPCQKKKCPQGIFRSAKEMLEFCKEAYPSLIEAQLVKEHEAVKKFVSRYDGHPASVFREETDHYTLRCRTCFKIIRIPKVTE